MRPFTICAVLLLLGSSLASAAPEKEGSILRTLQDRSAVLKEVADSKPLFFSLGSDVRVAGIRQIRFVVTLNDKLFVRETIAVPPGQAAEGTFELLAARPDLLARLYTAEGRNAKITVSVQGDGRDLKTSSFRDFVTYNRMIKTTTRLQLRFLKSEVEILDPAMVGTRGTRRGLPQPPGTKSQGWTLDQSCVDYCEALRQDCLGSGACGTEIICTTCNDQYDSCVNSNCWVWTCVDPKSQSTSDSYELVNVYWYGGSCLEDIFNSLDWYNDYQLVYKKYQNTHTEYCDDTTSDSSVYLYDVSVSCSQPTGSGCSFSQGFATNVCY
jgi:hypothetical protein